MQGRLSNSTWPLLSSKHAHFECKYKSCSVHYFNNCNGKARGIYFFGWVIFVWNDWTANSVFCFIYTLKGIFLDDCEESFVFGFEDVQSHLILKRSQFQFWKEKDEMYLADNVPFNIKVSSLWTLACFMKAVSPFDDLCPGYNPTVTCYCSTLFVFKNELLLSSRLEDLMIDGEDLMIDVVYLLGSSNAINQYKRPIFLKFCAGCTAQN
mmetsp:Transcript_40111/g.51710  ORF Transcript_40111/g.51710 Transcript_40111/m.51710 type:complete len:209 (+) Transcript_40111:566-1192(+)